MMRISVALLLALPLVAAFSPVQKVSFVSQRSAKSVASTSRLYNVPPPAETDDPVVVKKYADTEKPPSSFFELQINCARAARLAMQDGHKLIEIEVRNRCEKKLRCGTKLTRTSLFLSQFPPLPANVLELDDVSAYDVALANIKLAVDFAKNFAPDQKVTILLPDETEAEIAIENYGATDKPHPGVFISSLRRSEEGDTRVFKVGMWSVELCVECEIL
jgi:hypothetical protein